MNEFLSMMASRISASRKIKQVFSVFDQDADGWENCHNSVSRESNYISIRFISSSELDAVMHNLGENLSTEEVSDAWQ